MRTIEVVTDIEASPDEVWAVLTDFTHYSVWTSYIQQISGRAEEGFYLRVVLEPPGRRRYSVFTPVLEATPGVRLAWAMVIPGVSRLHSSIFAGTHEFALTALPNSTTRLTHREFFSGLLARFVKEGARGAKEGFETFNAALKLRVEELVGVKETAGRSESGF